MEDDSFGEKTVRRRITFKAEGGQEMSKEMKKIKGKKQFYRQVMKSTGEIFLN